MDQMHTYNQFPPHDYLIQILKSCPDSALLYIDIWKNRSDDLSYKIDKMDVRATFLISPTLFRNKIIPLINLDLLTLREHPTFFEINLVAYDPNHF